MLLEDFNKITKPVTAAAFKYFRSGMVERHKDELANKLKKLGWEFYANGYFSSVYENSKKPYILKINDRTDVGYDAFVNFIHNIQNIHFPKISDKKYLTLGPSKYAVYLIEKLEFINDKKAREHIMLINYIIKNPSISLEKMFGNKIPPLFKKYPNLDIAIRTIVRHANIINIRLDLHAANIMQRKDGTIVIIDPYSFEKTSVTFSAF